MTQACCPCPLASLPRCAALPLVLLAPPTAAELRIQELAGLVKLLRRILKESQTKASEFVAAACKYEKEVGQQVRCAGVLGMACAYSSQLRVAGWGG